MGLWFVVGCGAAAFTRVGAASTHTQVTPDQMPMGYVSFDPGIFFVGMCMVVTVWYV